MPNSFREHLARQCAVSREKFGPGNRTLGIQEHIRQEFDEINKAASPSEAAAEWADVAILALDGLLRASRQKIRKSKSFTINVPASVILDDDNFVIGHVLNRVGEPTSDYVAAVAFELLTEKQAKNELRDFGNWRDHSEDAAIQHRKGIYD